LSNTNLTPLIPLSLKGEGEKTLERGGTPLLPTLPLPLAREGGQGDGLLSNLDRQHGRSLTEGGSDGRNHGYNRRSIFFSGHQSMSNR